MLLFQGVLIKPGARKVGFGLELKGSLSIARCPDDVDPFPLFQILKYSAGTGCNNGARRSKSGTVLHTHTHTSTHFWEPVQLSGHRWLGDCEQPGVLAVCWVISNESWVDCQSEVMSLKLLQTSKETRWWNIYTPADKITLLLCCACQANCQLFLSNVCLWGSLDWSQRQNSHLTLGIFATTNADPLDMKLVATFVYFLLFYERACLFACRAIFNLGLG